MRKARKRLKSLSSRLLRGIQHQYQLKRKKKLKRRIRRSKQKLQWSTLTVCQSQEARALRTLEAKVKLTRAA